MGGTDPDPTYGNYGSKGHSETVYIEYNTTLISYPKLLDHFWSSHERTYHYTYDLDVAYQSKIFILSEGQRAAADSSLANVKKQTTSKVYTTVVDANGLEFWPAEEYHQKYKEKAGARCR